jgi:hypothetical protein
MARWYARFDAGSETALDNTNGTEGFFTQLRVGSGAGVGAQLRAGLLASRSLLSPDVYEDLDDQNKDGSKGIYFPRDNATINIPTTVSWPTAYTSSVEGMKTPTSNTYGVADSINYSKRPDEVYSYTSSFVTESSPLDPISVSYQTYASASAATRAVLLSIESLAGASTTPFTRPGDDPFKTIRSVWTNPTVDYFAWDDFTPGQPVMRMDIEGLNNTTTPPEIYPGGDPVNTDIQIKYSVTSFAYPNDGNMNGEIGLNLTVTDVSSNPVAALQLNGGTHGGPLTIGSNSSGNGPTNPRQGGASTWSWDSSGKILTWTLGLTAGQYRLNCNARIYDVISDFVGATRFSNTFPETSTDRFDVKAGEPA